MKYLWPAFAGIAVGTAVAMCSLLFDKAPSIDRDAWLVIQCGKPVLALFVHSNGDIESFPINALVDLKSLNPRAAAATHKYLITINKDCDVKPQVL